MISRRNIRVKVMQTLYTIDSVSGDTKPGEPIAILTKKIEQSRKLYTYLIYFITEVARFSETDARQKAIQTFTYRRRPCCKYQALPAMKFYGRLMEDTRFQGRC